LSRLATAGAETRRVRHAKSAGDGACNAPLPCDGYAGEDGVLPESGSAAAASRGRYRTVVGLVIWNVVVTMLLFTVIVALFLVCINNRRARFRTADR